MVRDSKNLPFVAKLLQTFLRTNLRGQYRLTIFLSKRLRQLQFVPINISSHPPFYVDMRKEHSYCLLKSTPWETAPFESAEQNLMKHFVREGDVVFDIGANIGLHTVLLSSLVGMLGHIYVFEPNLELIPQLDLTVRGLNNATLYPYALSNRRESATLFIPEDHSMASLANWTGDRPDVREPHTITCEVRCIDELIDSQTISQPDFIKCDVEGAELLVFQGGVKTINRIDAPIILFEANVYNASGFGFTVEDAKNYLANLSQPKYQFFEISEDGGLDRNDTINSIHSNVLAIPLAKISSFPLAEEASQAGD